MDTPAAHIMVDAHVHIHEHFELNRLFLISLQNFRKALNRNQIYEPFESFLLLTESAGTSQFERLAEMIDVDSSDDFSASATSEPVTIRITTGGGQQLYIVKGRQIVTAENLEILALGYDEDYPDGRPLHYTLKDLEESGCLRVLPWGAGKWLGKRGKIIESLVSSWDGGSLFLGDNGNRPKFWPLPAVFAQAASKGIYNLPGSDPLPFSGLEKKAGSFGFMLRGQIKSETPFQSLASHVVGRPHSVTQFGNAECLRPFIQNQISMQIVKRGR